MPQKTEEEESVLRAATRWWKMHRPLSFTESMHLKMPTVNTKSEAEATLARAVARRINARKKKKTS